MTSTSDEGNAAYDLAPATKKVFADDLWRLGVRPGANAGVARARPRAEELGGPRARRPPPPCA
eukprot:11214036-Lingulodinium_polyedra.AAC.1